MTTRRDFLRTTAAQPAPSSTAAACSVRPGRSSPAGVHALPVMVNGKRVKTIDVHAHCLFHEAVDLMGDETRRRSSRRQGRDEAFIDVDERLKAMDAMAVDMEVLSINPFWYRAERDLAAEIVQLQNEKLARAMRFEARPLRRLRLARLAVPRSGRPAARDRGQEAGAARRRDRRQRRRRGVRRPQIPSGLGQGRGARRGVVHPSAEPAGARQAPQRQWLADQHHRPAGSRPRSRCST